MCCLHLNLMGLPSFQLYAQLFSTKSFHSRCIRRSVSDFDDEPPFFAKSVGFGFRFVSLFDSVRILFFVFFLALVTIFVEFWSESLSFLKVDELEGTVDDAFWSIDPSKSSRPTKHRLFSLEKRAIVSRGRPAAAVKWGLFRKIFAYGLYDLVASRSLVVVVVVSIPDVVTVSKRRANLRRSDHFVILWRGL
jgi:hypothetical protein